MLQVVSSKPSSALADIFPANFVWGVATSSYQIEGATTADGRGPSIWDEFCRVPGAIADASHGDVACDHYHRLESDLDLVASLGVNAYRFSVSWSRVQPDGQGAWNEKGLDFYERMVDGLLKRGIQPFLTLNHWDLPQALQLKGGWNSRDTVDRFVDYSIGIHKRLGNRLASIVTHNEPWVVAVLGNETGIFAPGIKSRSIAAQVSHHLLLSHGRALQALGQEGCKAKLGIVLNLAPIVAATEAAADIAQATLDDGKLLRWYMDPLFKGQYPEDVLKHLGPDAPKVAAGDLDEIATPMDFIGVNYYSRSVASATAPFDVNSSGLPITDMGWEVYPQGLTELLVRMHQDYAVPPIYITENGGAFKDQMIDEEIRDADRTSYIESHIAAVADAIALGVPMAGYMVWSLLDNFEWASGYVKRFGIVHVDYQTQKRTLKDSAKWYANFLRKTQPSESISVVDRQSTLVG
jgi:beta-glucosidase